MDPIVSWMDAEAVRQMASQLVAPMTTTGVGTPDDAGFDETFVGYVVPGSPGQGVVRPPAPPVATEESPAEPPPKPFFPPATAEAEPKAPAPPPLPPAPEPAEEVEPVPAVIAEEPPPTSDESTLGRRMARFRQWLEANFKSRGAFVLDRDGNPVIDDPAFAKLHFLARSLAQAYRPVKGEAGNVHVKIGSDAFLSVVPVDTAFGCLVLGVVLPTPLDAKDVRTVAAALEQVARPVRH
ncbi:hypothetical protein [Haloferula sargassicola]|uniref:Roadblock/LAMTOR2 domain-containing protein n=1 Tax=Haloferula sargassicola TaxID=490096 RepID=A0ABP9UPV9_9BACT